MPVTTMHDERRKDVNELLDEIIGLLKEVSEIIDGIERRLNYLEMELQ